MSVRSKVAFSDLKSCTSSYLKPYDAEVTDFLLLTPSTTCSGSPAYPIITGPRHRLDTQFVQTPPHQFQHLYSGYHCLHTSALSTSATKIPTLGPFQLLNMCTIQYIIYRCEHWIPQPQRPNGEVLRICRQAEEERLGFACPQTQREHKVIDRSQGVCRDCMWKQVLR